MPADISNFQWWMAELKYSAQIDQIFVYADEDAYTKEYYKKFNVKTSVTGKTKSWKSCKDYYTMTKPLNPHIIQCSNSTVAKYIRLKVIGQKVQLHLREVRVIGGKFSKDLF